MWEPKMRRRFAGICLGITILAAAAAAYSQRVTARPDPALEYWLVEIEIDGERSPTRVIQERLNTLGEGGWELVETRDAIDNDGAVWLVMKRPAR